MKILLILCLLFASSVVLSQYSTLTIIVKPNKSRTILVDGKNYLADNNLRGGKKNEFTITDLNPGQHTITVTSAGGDQETTSFTLFPNYDMTIYIERSGSLRISEHRNVGYEVSAITDIKPLDFIALFNSVEQTEYNSEKILAVTNAFLNPNYHFTSLNAVKLISLVDGDSSKLQLAKLSYSSLTDTASFDDVINIFHNPDQRSELIAFAGRVNGLKPATSMSAEKFNMLLADIGTEQRVLDKDDAILAAFSKRGNRFTTSQASRLIELSGTEKARLSLAKAAFKTLTDPGYFTEMYQLFNRQASRNELAFFISIANPSALFRPNAFARVAMTSADFALVLNKVRFTDDDQRKQAIANIFASPYYLLSCEQIRELLARISSEKDRLSLLKSSYRITVDRQNFSNLADLLLDNENKSELERYTATYLSR